MKASMKQALVGGFLIGFGASLMDSGIKLCVRAYHKTRKEETWDDAVKAELADDTEGSLRETPVSDTMGGTELYTQVGTHHGTSADGRLPVQDTRLRGLAFYKCCSAKKT